MLKIRLRRMGAKKAPFYRIVVADSRAPRGGAFVEEIGYYNPISEPVELKVDVEKARNWMKNGAQPTDTVRSLLKKSGAIEYKQVRQWKRSSFRTTVLPLLSSTSQRTL